MLTKLHSYPFIDSKGQCISGFVLDVVSVSRNLKLVPLPRVMRWACGISFYRALHSLRWVHLWNATPHCTYSGGVWNSEAMIPPGKTMLEKYSVPTALHVLLAACLPTRHQRTERRVSLSLLTWPFPYLPTGITRWYLYPSGRVPGRKSNSGTVGQTSSARPDWGYVVYGGLCVAIINLRLTLLNTFPVDSVILLLSLLQS